ncbi:sulfiredoxin isoform X2 [Drosophila takahashii]|uniref:sulfiredoxin isoform X2 n=1 Tax=Drosophila takahashii TaxID=29030 RepID=UPI001CF8B3A6|nr:putative sulfiredoxin isoform X2 [Drosophila takahashii]
MEFISQFIRLASRRGNGFGPILQRNRSSIVQKDTMDTTIHSAGIAEIHMVPMSVIQRPIPSVLDEKKVQSLMETIKGESSEDEVPPIDLLWITGDEGGDYYFSFGGCHRFEAYKRLQRPEIKAKLVKSTLGDLYHYMGSSAPKYLA